MKYIDEYRDPTHAARLVAEIKREAKRRWTLMEVCGGQTHSLLKHGIEQQLADVVELIHGPGCPVCVTSLQAIDLACRLCQRDDVVVCSFGDMLRVPGSLGTLQQQQAAGGAVRTVYSPLEAVTLAQQKPELTIVFFAVGFETTAPATALAVRQAAALKLNNFTLLVAHVCVQPAMEALLQAPANRVQAFLAAGHVCTIVGLESYQSLVERFHTPVVATGFEPIDLLDGILAAVRQLNRGEARVENRYARSVRQRGNAAAQEVLDEVYEVCDRDWRGMGSVAEGGLRLRSGYAHYDAELRFASEVGLPVLESSSCRAADVLAGNLRPPDCEHFAAECTPEHPLGAPMVSSEGACAAYFHYTATTPPLGRPASEHKQP